MNILFMGTPDFALKSLEAIYENNYNIIGVVTNPDKPKGRGMKLQFSDVKKYAIEKNLKIFQPQKIKNNTEFIEQIKNLEPDIICVVAYGKILPKEILEIPKLGCINVHGSLLPKYRGAAPIQWAILNGETTTGVTTMYMDEGMDTGDIILKKEIKIDENETTGELWQKLAKMGGELLVETLKQIESGNAPREKQGNNYTMAPMLSKEIAKINWEEKRAEETAEDIKEERKERLSPFSFSACGIPVGAEIEFYASTQKPSGIVCTVVDDKHVTYNEKIWSLSALATELLQVKWQVAGPRFFKYDGEWLNDIRQWLGV